MTLWVDQVDALLVQPSSSLAAWLLHSKHISKDLRKHCRELKVDLKGQHQMHAYVDEYDYLQVVNEVAWIREIFLNGDNVPLTYGRVVVPANTYQRYQHDFENLGDKPIGETLLYPNPLVTRSPFQYAYFSNQDPILQAINQHLNLSEPLAQAFGRRSSFLLPEHCPLLITEVFLPTLGDRVP